MRLLGKIVLAAIVLLLTYPYASAPIYTERPPAPFTGDHWLNPYDTLPGSWVKANVHLHSRAWFGTTDGRANSPELIDSAYRALGYGVLALSNYQRIDSLGHNWVHLPCYEHGYNIQKTHQVVLGAKRVVWLDCILPQPLFVKQWILDVLRPTAEVLILAHPAFGRPSYHVEDCSYLGGYDCIEVFNHYRTSLAHWDSALSAGICVWAVGNDDCHNARSQGETGVCLTLLNLPAVWTAEDVYTAYRNGRTIAVKTTAAALSLGVPMQRLRGDSLMIECEAIADSIRLIGQGGKLRARFVRIGRIVLALPPDEHYLRAEIYVGNTCYALNPIIRTQSGVPSTQRRLEVHRLLTLAYRIAWVVAYALGAVALFRKRKR